MSKGRAALALLMLCLLCLTSLTGCSSGSSQNEEGAVEPVQDILIIGYGRDFLYGPEDVSFVHMSTNVWESLTALDENLDIQPVLLESWKMAEGGQVWTFNLKDNVFFHDGTPFNAETVIYNIDHHLVKNSETRAIYENVDKIEKLDDQTLNIYLKEANTLFPNEISSFGSPMFSIASFNEDGTIKFPYGTGSYKLKEYESGDYITIEKFEDYYGEKGKISTIQFKTIADENARMAALISGEIDAIADVGAILPEQAQALQKEAGIKVYSRPVATSHYMFFNTGREPFNNQDLRQAVSLSIDRDNLVSTVVNGYGTAGASVITPLAKKWFSADAAPGFDLAQAKKLAGNASYNGKVVIMVNSSFASRWPYKDIAQIVQSRLSELGVDSEIKILDGGAWNQEVKVGNYDICFHPYTLQTGEPDFYFGEWLDGQGTMNASRHLAFNNPSINQQIEAARQEADENKKIAAYKQLQQEARDLAVMVPLYHEVAIYAARDYVKDLDIDPQFKPDLARVGF